MHPVVRRLIRISTAIVVTLYRATGGRLMASAKGSQVVLLTVRGRTTGTPRTVPVAAFAHDGGYLLVGSAGGAPQEPQWFRNLRAAPTAHLQVKGAQIDTAVRIAEPAERDELWRSVVVDQAPGFAAYEKKTTRPIPIAVLTPA